MNSQAVLPTLANDQTVGAKGMRMTNRGVAYAEAVIPFAREPTIQIL